MIDLFRALATLCEPPQPETGRIAKALGLPRAPTEDEYAELFVFQLYPYASVYLGAEGMLGGEARDRIAGFWRAIGETPPNDPDHLAVMLALYARLAELAQGATEPLRRGALHRARMAFLWEHLLSWMPVYLNKLLEIAPPVYGAWAELLEKALLGEARNLAGIDRLPLHLREAPPVPMQGPEVVSDVPGLVLVPVRSGIILTRADLVRGARGLGLAPRVGERRFALDALLGQNPDGVLGWLAAEAHHWITRHEAQREILGEIARFWAQRARRTAAWLSAFRGSAEVLA